MIRETMPLGRRSRGAILLTHAREADCTLRRRELLPRRLLQPDLVDHSRELVPVGTPTPGEKFLVCVSLNSKVSVRKRITTSPIMKLRLDQNPPHNNNKYCRPR